MSELRTSLPPELESRLREIAVKIRRRALLRGWMRFGVATFGLAGGLTVALMAGETIPWLAAVVPPIFALGLLAAFAGFVLLPLRGKVSLGSVARHIDERHPELEDRILSAVEFSGRASGDGSSSAWMIEKCLEEAKVRVEEIRWGDLVDARLIARLAAMAVFFMLLSLGVILVQSDLWLARMPGLAVFVPVSAHARSFTVEPGNARVREGESQIVWVKSDLAGRKVDIQFRNEGQTEWTSLPMTQGASEKVHHHTFAAVRADIEYRVRFGAESSEHFKIAVWTPPRTEAIDLTYHYPEYLGRPSRETPNSGNITGVEGTRVDLAVKTNKAVRSARIVLESGGEIPLKKSLDTVWTGTLELARDDKYQVELVDLNNAPSEYNPRYSITVQPDKPPQVKLEFPRGDSQVTMLDEVPVNFEVEDDHGLESYGLRYEVAGREPQRITLEGEGGAVGRVTDGGLKIGGSHLLELENLGLAPGDLVSWTVWARDRKPGRTEDELLSDIYFLEIRPFRSEFEEAESGMQGMEGMSGAEEAAGDQKEIIIATWNLKRRAKSLGVEEFAAQKAVITDSQRQLQTKYQQAREQGGLPEEAGKALIEAIGLALGALKRAELPEPGDNLGRALVEMQKAYSLILKQKPDRTRVQQTQGQGSSGRQSGTQDEIAELEMDQNRNFYEEEKRTRQEAQEDTEQVRSRIKELAQRQKLIHTEIAKLISEIKKAETEQEKEKLRRRLESLREEERKAMARLDELQKEISQSRMGGQQSRQASSALEDVRQQMNRTLENMQTEDRLQQARLSSSRALDQLDELDENLQNISRTAAAEMMRDLQQDMRELVERQEELSKRLDETRGANQSPSLRPQENTPDKINDLLAQKQELERQFKDIMNNAGDLAEKARKSQELLSRRLGDWLRETAADGILEGMQASQPMIEHSVWPSAIENEQAVTEKLTEAEQRLAEAAQSVIEDDLQGMQKALGELQAALESRRPDASSAGVTTDGDERTTGAAVRAAANDPRTREIQRRTEQAMNRAESFMRNGKPEEAVRQLEQALDKDPENADARNQLGLARAQLGDLERAIQEFQSALINNPEHEAAQNNLKSALAMAQSAAGTEKSEHQQPTASGRKTEQAGQAAPSKGEQSRAEQPASQRQPGQSQGEEGGTQQEGGEQPGGQHGEPGRQFAQASPSNQNLSPQDAPPGEAPAPGGATADGRQNVSGGEPPTAWSGELSPNGPGAGATVATGWESWRQPPSPQFMEQFMRRDYKNWLERLRDAEALLPRESGTRETIERIRGRVEELRQDFKRHAVPPQYDLFLNEIIKPAAETAEQLRREIREALKDQEYRIADEGEVPAQYRRSVADYFESLSQLADAER